MAAPRRPGHTTWSDNGPERINRPDAYLPRLADAAQRLSALASRVRADIHMTRHPEMDWMARRDGPDGEPMLDVLVVGAGQGGLSVAAHLKR